ncbi:VOC family protein [Rhodococcus sp. NPDC056743]
MAGHYRRRRRRAERLLRAGASELRRFEGHHVIMADPEVNEFCVA